VAVFCDYGDELPGSLKAEYFPTSSVTINVNDQPAGFIRLYRKPGTRQLTKSNIEQLQSKKEREGERKKTLFLFS
jgi:hypothetical protein